MVTLIPEADRHAIQKLNERITELWGLELEKQLHHECFTKDGDANDHLGSVIRGGKIASTLLDPLLGQNGTLHGSALLLETRQLQLVRPEIAIVDGTWKVDGIKGTAGEVVRMDGFYTCVMIKKGANHLSAKWAIRSLRWKRGLRLRK